jgi:hypothetical protein
MTFSRFTKAQMEVVDLTSCTSFEQVARFNRRFVPDKRLAELPFLEWKYRLQKPHGGDITQHYGVLNDKNEIVAQISVQPMEAWVGGQWHQCHYWGDWYADPAYRGTGLVVLNYIMKQKPSLLAVSASEVALAIYERKRFLLLLIDYRFVFICRPLTAMLRMATTPKQAASIFLKWSKNPLLRVAQVPLGPSFQFSEDEPIDPRLLVDWESEVPGNTIFVRREEWLFSWLLDRFPFPEFHSVVLSTESQQIGYVLLHTRKREDHLVEGKIVDLFARGWDQTHLAALFRRGVQVLSNLGVHVIHYHATHPMFISLAEDSGFTNTRVQPVIAYGPLADALRSGETSLHMTYYDQDEAYY